MLPASSATGGRAVLAGVVLTSLPSNHAKAALLAVGGRLFQRFKGADPWILDFGLPVETGLGYFFVVESDPLLRSQILDDHSQPSPIGPKSVDAPALPSVKVNFLLTPLMVGTDQHLPRFNSARSGAIRKKEVYPNFHTARKNLPLSRFGLRRDGGRSRFLGEALEVPQGASRQRSHPLHADVHIIDHRPAGHHHGVGEVRRARALGLLVDHEPHTRPLRHRWAGSLAWSRLGLSGGMPPPWRPAEFHGPVLSISKHFDLSTLHGRTRCPSQNRIDVWSD